DRIPGVQPNQLFELTLEPPTGSPTGRPTGPIHFIGRSVKVS
ncbi:MAG: RNA polymerase subunit sigma-70, partial [Comamonas sp.]